MLGLLVCLSLNAQQLEPESLLTQLFISLVHLAQQARFALSLSAPPAPFVVLSNMPLLSTQSRSDALLERTFEVQFWLTVCGTCVNPLSSAWHALAVLTATWCPWTSLASAKHPLITPSLCALPAPGHTFNILINLLSLCLQVTPPMSSYLLAWVIGELDSVESTCTTEMKTVPLRVWSTPDK